MSIVNSTDNGILTIVKTFGLDPKNVKEVHIHIKAWEPVIVDVVAYATIDHSLIPELKQYKLIEVVK